MGSFLTPAARIEFEIPRIKNSRFLATLAPVNDAACAMDVVESLRLDHPDAGHHCFAYRLGAVGQEYRFSDDGEPGGSAGRPILARLEGQDVSDAVIVVSRWFGGVKLGVGGLIQSYREAARMALELGTVIEKEIKLPFRLELDYPQMDRVMRLIKEKQIEITSQDMGLRVRMDILVSKNRELAFHESLRQLHEVKLTELES